MTERNRQGKGRSAHWLDPVNHANIQPLWVRTHGTKVNHVRVPRRHQCGTKKEKTRTAAFTNGAAPALIERSVAKP